MAKLPNVIKLSCCTYVHDKDSSFQTYAVSAEYEVNYTGFCVYLYTPYYPTKEDAKRGIEKMCKELLKEGTYELVWVETNDI